MNVTVPAVSATTSDNGAATSRRVLHLVEDVDHGPSESFLAGRPSDRIVRVGAHPPKRVAGRDLGRLTPHVPDSRNSAGLRRLLRCCHQQGCRFDLLHAWGPRSTAMLVNARIEAVASFDGFGQDQPGAHAAARVVQSGSVRVLFGSHRAQQAAATLVGGGRSGSGQVAPPAASVGALEDVRAALRHRWRANDDTLVIGVIGGPIEGINIRQMAGISVRCQIIGHDVVVVASSQGARRGDFLRWMDRAGRGVRVVFDEDMVDCHKVANAIDIALAPAMVAPLTRISHVAPVLTMAAAGVPVVLGQLHPAEELTHREPLLHAGGSLDEHRATAWVLAQLEARGPHVQKQARQRGLERGEDYHRVLESLYSSGKALASNPK